MDSSPSESGSISQLLEYGEVSNSTDRRFNDVVQEYMKFKVIKSDDSHDSNVAQSPSNSSRKSVKVGPSEGSFNYETYTPRANWSPSSHKSKEDSFHSIPIHTPLGHIDFETPGDTNGIRSSFHTPNTPAIRITSVKGSSRDVLYGKEEVSSNRSASVGNVGICSTKSSKENSTSGTSTVKIESDIGEDIPMVLKSPTNHFVSNYPPEEPRGKSHYFRAPSSSRYDVEAARSGYSYGSRGISPQRTGSIFSSSWHREGYSDLFQGLREYEERQKKLKKQEHCGWFLIIVGFLLVLSGVIAIMIIEIPAHMGDMAP